MRLILLQFPLPSPNHDYRVQLVPGVNEEERAPQDLLVLEA